MKKAFCTGSNQVNVENVDMGFRFVKIKTLYVSDNKNPDKTA
jgi:hypothetical protein